MKRIVHGDLLDEQCKRKPCAHSSKARHLCLPYSGRRAVLPHLDAAYNLARWLARDAHDAEDVLVYAYRQHTIDVFVRPGLFHGSSSASRNVRGFNVARATGSGMDWLAVSDVSADVQFMQRLAEGPATNR